VFCVVHNCWIYVPYKAPFCLRYVSTILRLKIKIIENENASYINTESLICLLKRSICFGRKIKINSLLRVIYFICEGKSYLKFGFVIKGKKINYEIESVFD